MPYVCAGAEADHLTGRFDRARTLLHTELRAVPREHPRERAALLISLASGAFLRGALAEAFGHARQASAQAAIIFDSLDDGVAASQLVHLGGLAWANYYLGWHDQVLRVVRRAVELAQHTGHVATLPFLLLCEGKAQQFAGRLQRAHDVAEHAEDIARLNGSDEHLSMALAAKAEAVFWIDGSAAAATQLALQAVAAAGWRTGLAGRRAVFVLAEIALAAGAPQRSARQLVADSGGSDLPAWPRPCRPRVFEPLTRAALVDGDLDQARRWVASTEEAGTHLALGGPSYAKRARAQLMAGLGDHHRAAELALTAAEGFGIQGFLLEEAQSRIIAVRALTGMTNREIANRLHVTIRTVDAHVSRILRKLDVSSRAAVVGLQIPGSSSRS